MAEEHLPRSFLGDWENAKFSGGKGVPFLISNDTFLGCDSSWVGEIALLSQISQGEVFTEVVEPIDAALSNDSVKTYTYSHHCLSIIILTLKFNLSFYNEN